MSWGHAVFAVWCAIPVGFAIWMVKTYWDDWRKPPYCK